MDPHSLIAPVSPMSYPTPFWFIQFFKVFGFTLHVIPMSLWYAGGLIALIFGVFGRGNSRLVGSHIARALPFALAFGINFGIIPLLFMQVAYHQFYYTATILIAWPWFSVFWLVMAAYAGIYLYALAISGRAPLRYGRAAGWLSAIILIFVGFLFTNAMTLLVRPEAWWEIFKRTEIAGSVTGLALNSGDPTLLPRWLMMFGLAIMTTAVFLIVDAAFLSGKETADYRKYAGRFAAVLYSIGILWFVGFGSWYMFGTLEGTFSQAIANPIMMIIFPLTALSPGLPWLLTLLQRNGPTRMLATLAAIAQFGVVGLNAISRQWLQNRELGAYVDLAAHPSQTQTGILVAFLLLFAFGIALIGWMIRKMVEANRREAVDQANQA